MSNKLFILGKCFIFAMFYLIQHLSYKLYFINFTYLKKHRPFLFHLKNILTTPPRITPSISWLQKSPFRHPKS